MYSRVRGIHHRDVFSHEDEMRCAEATTTTAATASVQEGEKVHSVVAVSRERSEFDAVRGV